MKKRIPLVCLFSLIMLFSSSSFAQLFMDGDSTDWQNEPVLIEWVNNVDGLFPEAVGAAVTDVVDLKQVKAKVIGNAIYIFFRFWGGPAWPNQDESEHEGTPIYRARGYYHLLLDLDNDITTGWNTAFYEGHYSPVGYLASQGVEGSDPIGAEVMMEWGSAYGWSAPHPDSGKVSNIDYWGADYSEYNGETDTGSEYEIYNIPIPNPDTLKGMSWQGSSMINSSDYEPLANDSLRSFWAGHGWGVDFLEFGTELTPQIEYWQSKGHDYFKPGDVIGLCGMIETPLDDWGCDFTTRGELTIPEMPLRPSSIVFDGDDADWQDKESVIEWVDNVDGLFPEAVGAAVTDVVDIKAVKSFINADENAIYFLMRFWGGPAWPNKDESEHEGTPIYRARGYYHLLLDLDNDITTGWNTAFYEGHYSPVGYLASQGVEGSDPIGAEVMIEWGSAYGWSAPHPDNGKISDIDYWGADYSEYNGETDTGSEYEIFEYPITDPDSVYGMHHDGLLVSSSSDVEILLDGQADWMAHAWGYDFIEVGQCLRNIKNYWLNKDGREIFQTGDEIGLCGMTETPMDDWGCDFTTRGVVQVITGIADERPGVIASDFVLENNYPNPFNPVTTIGYTVPKTANVNIAIYNTIGQKVRTLVDTRVPSGTHTVVWDGRNDTGQLLTSGIYFYRLISGSQTITKRMVLLK